MKEETEDSYVFESPNSYLGNTPAKKAGYRTIVDICAERIRRVISKINNDVEKKPELFTEKNLDLGFKAFTLEPSNFKKRWCHRYNRK